MKENLRFHCKGSSEFAQDYLEIKDKMDTIHDEFNTIFSQLQVTKSLKDVPYDFQDFPTLYW